MVFAIWEKKSLRLKNWFGKDARLHVNWLGHMKQRPGLGVFSVQEHQHSLCIPRHWIHGVYFSFLKYVRPATLEGMDGTQMIPDPIYRMSLPETSGVLFHRFAGLSGKRCLSIKLVFVRSHRGMTHLPTRMKRSRQSHIELGICLLLVSPEKLSIGLCGLLLT